MALSLAPRNPPPATRHPPILPYLPYFPVPATSSRLDAPANVIQMHAAAAGLRLHPPADCFYFQAAATGFCFHQLQPARHLNTELSGEAARLLAFGSLPADPSPVTLRSGAHADHLERSPRLLFRAGAHPLTHCVADIALIAALDMHRAHVGDQLQIVRRLRQRAADFLYPGIPLLIDLRLLRPARQRGQRQPHPVLKNLLQTVITLSLFDVRH